MSDLEDRVVPDLETRLAEAVDVFRDNHRDPANLALHAVAALVALSGLSRLLHGHPVRAAKRLGVATGLMLAGHRIEGSDPGQFLKALRGPES